MSPEYRGAPKSYLSITISRRDLGRLGLRTTFLAVVMGIARGFIASGTTRIRSTCRSPFSRLALLIWTWSASWKLRSKQKRGAIASSKTARRSCSPDVTMPDQSFPRRSQCPFHDPDKIIAALRRGRQTLDFERTDGRSNVKWRFRNGVDRVDRILSNLRPRPQLARCSARLLLWRGMTFGPSAEATGSGTSLAPRLNLR